MIWYHSTRGNKSFYTFLQAVLKGVATDGGLFVPDKIPHLDKKDLERLINKSYQERAFFILHLFKIGISDTRIKEIIHRAYGDVFDDSRISPLVELSGNRYVLELWHGPTLAFKDMALQIMPLFFEHAVNLDNAQREKVGQKKLHYQILVATSGDTGKAALEGFKNKESISIIVFFPKNGVARLQALSMLTQKGRNVCVVEVDGDFDAIQTSIKETYADRVFSRKLLNNYQTVLSSANSINWGRVLSQIIYHVSAYANMVRQNYIHLGDQIDVAVPTGNFGNILAAFYAKKMGLPIRKLICASNSNKVLTEFLRTGVYDIRQRTLVKTPSPSMDIIIASNIERLLYEITNDAKKLSRWMKQLKSRKYFKVDKSVKKILQDIFYADWVSNDECFSEIKNTWQKYHYLIDPHTAVAKVVADRYLQDSCFDRFTGRVPMVVCSTAHWSKFGQDVYKALNGEEKESEALSEIEKMTGLHVPRVIKQWQTMKIRHMKSCTLKKSAFENVVLGYLS